MFLSEMDDRVSGSLRLARYMVCLHGSLYKSSQFLQDNLAGWCGYIEKGQGYSPAPSILL